MVCTNCGERKAEIGTYCGVPEGEKWCRDCTIRALVERKIKYPKPVTDLRTAAQIRIKLDNQIRYHCRSADICPRCGNVGDDLDHESYEVPGVNVCIVCSCHEAELLCMNMPDYPKPWRAGGFWSGNEIGWDEPERMH